MLLPRRLRDGAIDGQSEVGPIRATGQLRVRKKQNKLAYQRDHLSRMFLYFLGKLIVPCNQILQVDFKGMVVHK